MPWRFVLQPNDLLAVFSTVVDDFIAYGMTREEAIEYCRDRKDMGRLESIDKVNRGLNDLSYGIPELDPKPMPGKLSRWRDSLNKIMFHHGPAHLRATLLTDFKLDPDAPENQPCWDVVWCEESSA